MTIPLRLPLLLALTAALAAGASGCNDEHEYEPPDRARQVDEASRQLSEAIFDTVAWSSDSARTLAGENLYAVRCRKCHGYLGEGETEYAARYELDVPSLVEPDWDYAGKLDSVRREIFVGHLDGMPTWGAGRLSPRQIDAAAYYVLQVLRPDVLDEDGREAEAGSEGRTGS